MSSKHKEKEEPKRLTPTKSTLNLLFALSGNQCAFPGCENKLFNAKNKLIANVCHIEGALAGGERFNAGSNNEERRHFDNLIALCLEHHVETDDVMVYKTEDMRRMKAEHELKSKGMFSPNSEQIDNAFESEVKRSLSRIEDTTTRIEATVLDSSSQLHELKAMVAQFMSADRAAASEGQKGYDSKLDEIFIYRSNGKPHTAIDHFRLLRQDEWSKMNDHEKYRWCALTGLCQIDLLDNKCAAESFIEGLGYQPENVKAINFGIVGYFIQRNFVEAEKLIDKGLSIDPHNSGILSSKIRLTDSTKLNDLAKSLPKEVMKDVEIAFELARKYREQKDYKSADKWLETAKEVKDGDKYDILSLQATFCLESIFDNFKIISGQTSTLMLRDAKKIVRLYTQAWEEIEGTELAESRVWFLINRGIAKKILGDKEGFYEDILYAANLNSSYDIQHQLLMAAVELGKIAKAEEIMAKLGNIANEEQRLELEYTTITLLLIQGRAEKAEVRLDKFLLTSLPKRIKVNALLDAYGIKINLKKPDEAEKIVIEIEKLIPEALPTMTIRARIDAILGKADLQTSLLAVKEKVDKAMPNHEIQILADDLARVGCHSAAADLYEMIVDQDVYSPMLEKLLNSYNIIGENAKILDISEKLIDKYGPIRLCSEMVSYVYERIRDDDRAIKTCEDYLKVNPDDQHMRLRLAAIHDRVRDFDQLQIELAKFDHLDTNLNLEHQFMLSRLMLKVGMLEKSREFAYQSRRQFFDKSRAHEHFFAFHLEEEKSRVVSRGDKLHTVGVDTVVKLKTDTNTLDLILEQRGDGIESRGERSVSSYEGSILMGKNVGDKVALHKNYKDHLSEIISITPKFDFAITESLHLLNTVFVNQSTFRSFQLPESKDPVETRNALFDLLEQFGNDDGLLIDYYRSGNYPISSVAAINGNNPVSIWLTYSRDPSMGIHAMKDVENFETGVQFLEQGKPLVFEIIGLLTCFQLELQEFLQGLPNRKIIVKSTVNHVRTYLEELIQLNGQPIVNIIRVGDEVVREVTTSEDIAENICFLERILSWVELHAEVVPCEAALSINWEQKQKYDDSLGESAIDAMLTVRHLEGLLIGEESSTRELAKSELGVEGLCCFQLVFGLYRMKVISLDNFQEAIFVLQQLNYRLIPVTSTVLVELAALSRDVLDASLSNAINGLRSRQLPMEMTFLTASTFVATIYTKPIRNTLLDSLSKEKIVVRVTECLCSRFEVSVVREELNKALTNALVSKVLSLKLMRIVNEYLDSITQN